MNYDISKRFSMLIFETAEEYLEKKRIQLEKAKIETEKYRRMMEEKGVCEHCSSREPRRWIRQGEFYSCYECFINDLSCEGSVMVPMHNLEEMKDFVEEYIWDELAEEEHQSI